MRSGTKSSRFAARSGESGRPSPSVSERNAVGQTTSPVLRLMSREPSMPGTTITGRLPVRAFVAMKMRARSGVRRGPQPKKRVQNAECRMMNAKMIARRFLFITLHSALITFFIIPLAIDQACDKARAEAVVYVDDRDVRGARVEHA